MTTRSYNCTNKRAELIRFLGRKAYWKKERRKKTIMKILVLIFKPWTHSKLGKYVKGIITKK